MMRSWFAHEIVATRLASIIQGLLLNRGHGNCSRFARKVRNCSSQALQNFITDSPWNERIVIGKIQREVTRLIGDPVEGSIHIDET